MLRHVVVFRFNEISAAQLAAIDEALGGLTEQIPALQDYSFGPDLRLSATNGDYAITALVDDESALEEYMSHPAHLLARQLIDPHVETATAVQLTA